MPLFLDSFWRAVFYCLNPRVIVLSILPLGLMVVLSGVLGYWYWDEAVAQVHGWLEASSLLSVVWRWFDGVGVSNLKTVVAPLLVIFAATPLLVIASLMAVSLFMTPALTRLVAERRFPGMASAHSAGFWPSLGWTLASVLLAVGALVLTLPLWLVPPMAMVMPPLIWGWLTYRVMSYDVLGEFASRTERERVMARHRLSLLGMGVLTGLMGGAPSMVWASGALFAAAFVILIPVAIWIYMLVFAFSSLWFAHFMLAALAELRAEEAAGAGVHTDAPGTNGPVSLHASARLAATHEGLEDRHQP